MKGWPIVAKDKSKKKGGVSDDFAKPSEAKASGDGFNFEKEENLGKLFLITPLRVQTAKGFEGKESEVVVADIVELDEKKPERSVEHEEVFVWGGWTKGAIRGFIGDKRVLVQSDKILLGKIHDLSGNPVPCHCTASTAA